MSQIEIFYFEDRSPGWAPITTLVALAGKLFETLPKYIQLPNVSRMRLCRLLAIPPVREGPLSALFIAKSPAEIRLFMSLNEFNYPYRMRAVWIVDSFWTEWLPWSRLMSRFDVVAFMQLGDRDHYKTLAGERALALPWGADVLDFGSGSSTRSFDILRVGRQTQEWNDDTRSRAACDKVGLRFQGRPPYLSEPFDQQQSLMAHYANSKYLIAHSNRVAPGGNTHPEKEYVTARWTDAIGSGAIPAGVQPRSDQFFKEILWPGATIDLLGTSLEENVQELQGAVSNWSPAAALLNYTNSLRRLDWRWRLKSLADRLDLRTPTLAREMRRLELAINTKDEQPPRS